jgi:replicative DNA helicase
MALADDKKQKLLIQDLLSSPEVYTKTAGILKPSYFDNALYVRVVSFIHEYYKKYNATPSVEQVNVEFDTIDLQDSGKLTKDRIQYSCDEIEKFCKETAIRQAILDSLGDIEKHEMSKVLARITDAVNISLQRDMGIDVFDDPENRLKSLIENYTPIPTGISGLDEPLGGGLLRKQLTMLSANSGGGKSIMMNNIGSNFTLLENLHVVLISLELEDSMVFLRTSSIMTGHDTANWKAHIPEISSAINNIGNGSTGTFVIKRLPAASTSADIRSYLSYYEMEYQRQPDVIIVDYLDLMYPNGGIKNIGVFEQDKQNVYEQLNNYYKLQILYYQNF